jgi:threonine synthase
VATTELPVDVPAGLLPPPTPLVRARRLGAALGLETVWLKDETANPTGSFKDRLVAVAAAEAVARGAPVLAAASTGNLGRAVRHAARRLGLEAVVLVPEGTPGAPAALAVRGGYDAANRLATEAAMRWDRWGWVNATLRPWYVEGAAALAHETLDQLGHDAPAHVVVPIASGATALRLHRAFTELGASVGLSVAQPAGCSPVADAFAAGADDVAPVRPATRVASLAMGDPPDGPDVLAAMRASGGAAVAVPEDEVDAGVELVADTEGIRVEPAGGVVVAALGRLVEAGVIGPGEPVVVYLTGGPAPSGEGGRSPAVTIDPTLEALAGALPERLQG